MIPKALEVRPATLETIGRLATFEKGQIFAATHDSGLNQAKKMLDMSIWVTVYRGSCTTWSFATSYVERVQVVLQTEGRPLNADAELWRGPYDTPQKMRVKSPSTIAIRSTGQMLFPLAAYVVTNDRGAPGPSDVIELSDSNTPTAIQGGSLRIFSFHLSIESAQVFLILKMQESSYGRAPPTLSR